MRAVHGGVVFRVDAELFFLPATVAVRVVPVPAIGRVPGAPPELVGLALVEGDMVPVVSVGTARSAMLVVSYLGERLGLVGIDVVATGRFEAGTRDGGEVSHLDYVVHEGENARVFDVSAVVARVRETRWVV